MFEQFDELSTTIYALIDALDNYDEEASEANYEKVQSYNAKIKEICNCSGPTETSTFRGLLTASKDLATTDLVREEGVKTVLAEEGLSHTSPFEISEMIISSITGSDRRFFKANAQKPETWNISKGDLIRDMRIAASRVADVFDDHENIKVSGLRQGI